MAEDIDWAMPQSLAIRSGVNSLERWAASEIVAISLPPAPKIGAATQCTFDSYSAGFTGVRKGHEQVVEGLNGVLRPCLQACSFRVAANFVR